MPTNLITAIVTAYCATGHPCADGRYPEEGVTIAAPRCIPLGTRVEVGGHIFTVEDRTNKRFDGRWDVFMVDRKRCLQWGKQTLKVKILSPVGIDNQ